MWLFFDLIIVFRIANPYNISRQITNLPQLRSNDFRGTHLCRLKQFFRSFFLIPSFFLIKGKQKEEEEVNSQIMSDVA